MDAKKEAILLASKVNRTAINDLLLSYKDDFEATPKYLSVTRRLYNPFPDASTQGGMASTEDDSAPKDYEVGSEGEVMRHSLISNGPRAATIARFRADRNGLNRSFYNTMWTPTKNGTTAHQQPHLNTVSKIGHKTLQTPRQSSHVQPQRRLLMSGGQSTFKTATLDKQHFAELKRAVLGLIEANDRTLEEVRTHYAQHPHGLLKKSSLT